MIDFEQWEGFEGRIWKEEVNVRDFIQKNYTPCWPHRGHR